MNKTKKPARCNASSDAAPGSRIGLVYGMIAVALVAAFAFKFLRHPTVPAPASQTVATSGVQTPVAAPAPVISKLPPRPAAATPVPFQPAPPVAKTEAPPSAQQLVDDLAALGADDLPITPEQAAKFKKSLDDLIQRGATSVPAIQAYLQKSIDIAYADVSGGDQLGYPSLRASLIDALRQIGGPEAQAAMAETMQSTALPSELLALANGLEQQAPGEYREQILAGAQDVINMASADKLGTNIEVGPAFRMLQNYSTANTTADAANNDPLQFYTAVSLANLPDGQGLPSLLQMAQTAGASQTVATEMIAQLAGQNPQALDALTQMAQNNGISQDVWVKLAPILGGDQYQPGDAKSSQLSAGGQNFAIVNGVTTPDQINQRISLIDQFLGMVPDDSAAAAALRHQKGILSGKLGGQPN